MGYTVCVALGFGRERGEIERSERRRDEAPLALRHARGHTLILGYVIKPAHRQLLHPRLQQRHLVYGFWFGIRLHAPNVPSLPEAVTQSKQFLYWGGLGCRTMFDRAACSGGVGRGTAPACSSAPAPCSGTRKSPTAQTPARAEKRVRGGGYFAGGTPAFVRGAGWVEAAVWLGAPREAASARGKTCCASWSLSCRCVSWRSALIFSDSASLSRVGPSSITLRGSGHCQDHPTAGGLLQ